MDTTESALRAPALTLVEALDGAGKIAALLAGRTIEGAAKGAPSSKMAVLQAVEVCQDWRGNWWLYVRIALSRGKSLMTKGEVGAWLLQNASGERITEKAEW